MDMTDMKKLQTVFWHDDVLYAKDQTLVPYEEKMMRLETVQQVCDAIYALAIRGAPAIGVGGAYAMVLAVREAPSQDLAAVVKYLTDKAPEIAAVRPTATNLSWAVTKQMDVVKAGAASTEELSAKLLKRAHAISKMEVETAHAVSQLGADLLPAEGANIITHCNTGPLCTIDIGMCMGAAIYAHQQGKNVRVYTDETRPRLQGAKINAYELRQYGVPYTLITDNMAAYAMQQGLIDIAFVGADRLVANGDMAAKIGVYGLAVLAQAHGIPFYGFCPMSTFDDSFESGDQIKIEERPSQEVLCINGKQLAPEDTPVLNPAFDVTPHRYFAGIITEVGIAYPPYKKSLKELKAKYDERMATMDW
ncbi:S-methyl-5-thioribose-1-phosphate isomerase [Clostridia bacterium OttesenSCG-928-O13]|nr:S-methyl-5-thioribose-1-phosphate isomerase [Clostridia bacterium OttesenSCG-928-O13]